MNIDLHLNRASRATLHRHDSFATLNIVDTPGGPNLTIYIHPDDAHLLKAPLAGLYDPDQDSTVEAYRAARRQPISRTEPAFAQRTTRTIHVQPAIPDEGYLVRVLAPYVHDDLAAN